MCPALWHTKLPSLNSYTLCRALLRGYKASRHRASKLPVQPYAVSKPKRPLVPNFTCILQAASTASPNITSQLTSGPLLMFRLWNMLHHCVRLRKARHTYEEARTARWPSPSPTAATENMGKFGFGSMRIRTLGFWQCLAKE